MEMFFEVLVFAAEFAAWILFAIILAFLIEGSTEYLFGTPMDKIPQLLPYKWLLMYLAVVFGIFYCFFFKLDLLYVLTSIAAKLAGQPPIISISAPGIILTGIGVGRGSNYIHDFIKKHIPGKPIPMG